MEGLIPLILGFLSSAVPSLTTSVQIGGAIKILTAIIPPIIQTGKDLLPVVKQTLSTLSGNAGTTAEQLTELRVLDKACDDAFDAALAAAEAEDASPEA